MILLLLLIASTVFMFWFWRHRLRLRKRRDLLTTTFADRTAGYPRGPSRLNPLPTLSKRGGR